jgi:hypothetical protein
MGQDNNSNKERSLLLALLLFIGAGVLLFMSIDSDEKSPSTNTPQQSARERMRGADWERSVNKHLFQTNERMNMQRQKMQVENSKDAPRMWETKTQNAYKQNNGVDLSTDQRGYDIANDLGRGVRSNEAPKSPHEIVQGELFNEQETEAYTQAYKQEYARQFIENARRGGYEVQLSDDFRVLSVKPYRRPSGQGTVDPLYNSFDSSNQ